MTKIKHFYVESELIFKENLKHGSFKDLSGKKFNRLFVLGFAGKIPRCKWFCKCDCGKIVLVSTDGIIRGQTRSCGCLLREKTIRRNLKHGCGKRKDKTPEFTSWCSMRNRCMNGKGDDGRLYKDRGITICERWNKFENFLEDMGKRPDDTYSVDRIDNNGNYEPGNCRWATKQEQANNTRRNVLLEFNGKTQNVSQWTKELGFNLGVISKRLNRGWSVELTLTTPSMVSSKKSST